MTLIAFLVICALIATIVATIGKCPLWIAVFLLAFVEALRVWPLGS